MATLNFIRGTIRGKIGQFVGSSWKGKSYIKTFTKPGNPRTKDQMAVRTVFQNISHIAKAVYENVLKPYTFPKPRMQTAYNRMIQINKPMFDGKEWKPEMLKIFDGPLYNPGFDQATFEKQGAKESVLFGFNDTDGEKTDIAICIIYDEASGTAVFEIGSRKDVEISVNLGLMSPADKNKLHAYLVFAQAPADGNGETGLVSGTAYSKVA
jgi:hypothetical protein